VPHWGLFGGRRSTLSNLRSLTFHSWQPPRISDWASSRTEFTQLRCFTFQWGGENGVRLVEIAKHRGFKNLRSLKIMGNFCINNTDRNREALNQFPENVNSLQRLDLTGDLCISDSTFDTILNRHGRALRSLSLHPFMRHIYPRPFFRFTHATLLQLQQKCPNLEELDIPIIRTRGDDEEIGIYCALSLIPRLRRVSWTLGYWIGPDEELWSEERDGTHPLHGCQEDKDIEFAPLHEAFSKGAIDSTLALSIFNLISTGSN
jgi:hypothetical protein